MTPPETAAASFQSLLEAAPDAMLIIDRAGHILRVNGECERLFGYGRDELLGRSVELLIPERMRGRHAEHRHGFMTHLVRRPMGQGLELSAARKDGVELPVEISLSPVRAGAEILVIAAVRDVSERRRARLEIERLNARLEGRLSERTQAVSAMLDEVETLTHAVAHDLRAPLGVIERASAEMLDGPSALAFEEVRRIRAAAQHMGGLIDGLVELARVGRSPLNLRAVDLGALAADLVEQLRAAEPSRRVVVEIEPHLIARGDAPLLAVALGHLLDNAWRFTRPRATAHVRVGRAPGEGDAVFFVRDDGIGFDMAVADQLFLPFRTYAGDELSGRGVGLAIVRRIVGRHGGLVWATSRPGEGATFFFTLPPAPPR